MEARIVVCEVCDDMGVVGVKTLQNMITGKRNLLIVSCPKGCPRNITHGETSEEWDNFFIKHGVFGG